jgi:hypothetical protein
MRSFRWGAVLALGVSALASCSSGTYVVLTVTADGPAPVISTLQIDLTLDGKPAEVPIMEKGGGAIALPAEIGIELRSGAGALDVTVVALDADGKEVGRGHAQDAITVARGKNIKVAVQLVLGAPSLVLDRVDADFGTINTSTLSAPVAFVVTNTGTVTTGAVMTGLGGTDPGAFQIVSDQCVGKMLIPNDTCMLGVEFAPTADGARSGKLQVSATPGGGASATLSGKAAAPGDLQVTPTTPAFQPTVVGANSAPVTFTVKNTGGAPSGALDVALSGVNAAMFHKANDNCSTTTLNPNATCTVEVQFSPTASGMKAASLTVMATPGGLVATPLSATGQAPAALSVTSMSNHDFMVVDVGIGAAAPTFDFVIHNGGDVATPSLTTNATGDNADFSKTDGCNGSPLAGGASCTIKLKFDPASHGSKALTMTVGGGLLLVSVGATGVGRDQVEIKVTMGGNGNGMVTSPDAGTVDGMGMTCTTGTCAELYYRTINDPVITLTATSNIDTKPVVWSLGTCSGNTCDVALASATQTVGAAFNLFVYKLTVSKQLSGTGGAAGLVTSTGGVNDLNCGATCAVNNNAGTMLTLFANPMGGSFFAGWSGACTGVNPTCVVANNSDQTAVAHFATGNIAFVTSTTYTLGQLAANGSGSGSTKVIDGANKFCNARAMSGNLPGSYVAWISDTAAGAMTRITTANATAKGWVRRDGLPFMDTLPGPPIYYPLEIDELGNTVSDSGIAGFGFGFVNVWTGTAANGAVAASTCSNWSDGTAAGSIQAGSTGGGATVWTAPYFTNTCDKSLHLYCMDTSHSTGLALPLPDPGARIMFLSNGTVMSNAGRAAADTLCVNEANGVLPGNYLAVLPITGQSAASRFTVKNFAIMRPDRVVLYGNDADLISMGKPPLAAIDQYANGSYDTANGRYAYVGAPTATTIASANNDCNNWSVADATFNVSAGFSGMAHDQAWNHFFGTCAFNSAPVYCMQVLP